MLKKTPYLFFIFFLAFAVKIALLLFFIEPWLFTKYPFFAEKIIKGLPLGERILDLSPLYLFFTVQILRFFGYTWKIIPLIQIFLASINCVIIYLIGEKVFNRAVGFISVLLLLFYGNNFLVEITIEPDTLLIFTNSLAMLSLLFAREREKESTYNVNLIWILSGALIGLSILTKPNAFLILVLIVFWIIAEIPGKGKKLAATVLLVSAAGLIILPVTLRNYVVFNDPVVVTADFGKVFFHGNGPRATGILRADLPYQELLEDRSGEPDYAHVLFRETARQTTGRNLCPSECSRFWTFQTFIFMQANPGNALRLFGKKFILFWNNYEVQDMTPNFRRYIIIREWPLVPFGILSVFGLLGMGLAFPRRRQVMLLYLFVFTYIISLVLLLDSSRYRAPAAPFLALFAGYALVRVTSFLTGKNYKAILMCVLSILCFILVAFLPFKHEIARIDQRETAYLHYTRGNDLFNSQRYTESLREYETAIALLPNLLQAINKYGKTLAILNDFSGAEKNFKQVIRIAPLLDEGYSNLGLLYYLNNDFAKATPFLEKALVLNPGNQKVRKYLSLIKQASAQ